MSWWLQLDKTRGSRPRCVAMTAGTRAEVSARLTELASWPGVVVAPDDHWMPRGVPVQRSDGTRDVAPADEARLDVPNELLSAAESSALKDWWLEHPGKANTPNWDIASTCSFHGRKGLLLVEAKAHLEELAGEEHGKSLNPKASGDSFANHQNIGRAIADTAAEYQRFTGFPWAISRDRCYQMSNRFAMAGKLAEMGYPVVLVYLGFVVAEEMTGRTLIEDESTWRTSVLEHSRHMVPERAWDHEWSIQDQPFVPRIRCWKSNLDYQLSQSIDH